MDPKANTLQLYLSNFLTGLVFWYGIEKVFMQHIGINATGITINSALLLTIQLLFDIPTGILADRWSRKYTLLVSIVLLAISSLVLGTSHSFAQYLVGTTIFGLFVVTVSGTFPSITYDSLKSVGKEKDYAKLQGRTYAAYLAGVFIASSASGFIAQHTSLAVTFFITLIPCAINFMSIASMREPSFHKVSTDTRYVTHMKKSFLAIGQTKVLAFLAVLLVAATVVRGTQSQYSQLYFLGLHMDTTTIGIAFGSMALTSAIGSAFAHRLGHKVVVLYPLIIILLAIVGSVHSTWALSVFFATPLVVNAIQNQSTALIQDMVDSSLRATTISTLSSISNLILVPLGLLFGYLTDRINVFAAYGMVSVFSGLGLIVLLTLGYMRFVRSLVQETTSSSDGAATLLG